MGATSVAARVACAAVLPRPRLPRLPGLCNGAHGRGWLSIRTVLPATAKTGAD